MAKEMLLNAIKNRGTFCWKDFNLSDDFSAATACVISTVADTVKVLLGVSEYPSLRTN